MTINHIVSIDHGSHVFQPYWQGMFFAELVQEQWQEALQLGTLMDPGG